VIAGMEHEILVVDDEADIRTQICGILSDEGYRTREASTADEALASIQQKRPHLVILDIWLQGSRFDGIEVLKRIQKDHPGLLAIMISGHGTIETAVAAIKLGAYDFIEKPFKADRLLFMVTRALETARLKRENQELKFRMPHSDTFIGNSTALNRVKSSIEKVAPTNSRVLITGEIGTGKEIVARQIHTNSHRKNGPFIVFHCNRSSKENLEIDLLGQENESQGSYLGVIEQANGGTLFLDEVNTLPLEVQGKLIRFLQDQSLKRIGGTTQLNVDVRLITASSRDLKQEIAAGRMREDLFYRLNVINIEVPPLRERASDVPLLANYFLDQFQKFSSTTPKKLADDTLMALQAYHWPGNVRQLQNVIEGLVIMSPIHSSDPITSNLLPPEITGQSPEILKWDKASKIMSLPLREAREIFELEYLLAQVQRFGGNISKTAVFIGMERSALHRKLKSLNAHVSLRNQPLDGEEEVDEIQQAS
jgi:two-component system, NtrC family, nitrogen regulation response regulator NtrX